MDIDIQYNKEIKISFEYDIDDLEKYIIFLISLRKIAKDFKRYKLADFLRECIISEGYNLRDLNDNKSYDVFINDKLSKDKLRKFLSNNNNNDDLIDEIVKKIVIKNNDDIKRYYGTVQYNKENISTKLLEFYSEKRIRNIVTDTYNTLFDCSKI